MIEAGDLPAVNLSFSGTRTPVGPTKGRSLDHVGFDVANLEEFVKGLEARGIKMDTPDPAGPELASEDRVPHRPVGT
jgi:hypothetical protein